MIRLGRRKSVFRRINGLKALKELNVIVSPLIIVSKIGLYYFLYQVDPNLAYALGCADVGATLKFIHEWAQRKKTFEALMKKAKEAEKTAQGSRLDELYGRGDN